MNYSEGSFLKATIRVESFFGTKELLGVRDNF